MNEPNNQPKPAPVRAVSAHTLRPNTPESDRQKEVAHMVHLSNGKYAIVAAREPMHAIETVNGRLRAGAEVAMHDPPQGGNWPPPFAEGVEVPEHDYGVSFLPHGVIGFAGLKFVAHFLRGKLENPPGDRLFSFRRLPREGGDVLEVTEYRDALGAAGFFAGLRPGAGDAPASPADIVLAMVRGLEERMAEMERWQASFDSEWSEHSVEHNTIDRRLDNIESLAE